MVPECVKDQFETVVLDNNTYGIATSWRFKGGGYLPGPSIDIDTLAERYPDCRVGY